jgi:hypothetical protein
VKTTERIHAEQEARRKAEARRQEAEARERRERFEARDAEYARYADVLDRNNRNIGAFKQRGGESTER